MLHDDAEAEPSWLAALVRCADEHPEAGAVGSRVLNPDGTLQVAAPCCGATPPRARSAARRALPRRAPRGRLRRLGGAARAGGELGRGGRHGRGALPRLLRRRRPLDRAARTRGSGLLRARGARAARARRQQRRADAHVPHRPQPRALQAKWGEMLARQVEPGDLARACSAGGGGGCGLPRRGPAAASASVPPRPPSDDRRFLRLEREINVALIEQLTGEVESLHATIRRKDEDLRAQEAALHELSRRAGSSRTG